MKGERAGKKARISIGFSASSCLTRPVERQQKFSTLNVIPNELEIKVVKIYRSFGFLSLIYIQYIFKGEL